jgi:hypothetical protein
VTGYGPRGSSIGETGVSSSPRKPPKRMKRAGALPRGKTPGGPKGLPPGLGGAPRGQGATASQSGPQSPAVLAGLRARFKTGGRKPAKGYGRGLPRD